MKDVIHAQIESNGLVLLTIAGDVREDDLAELKSRLSDISGLVADEYRKHDAKVNILIDITDFAGEYHEDALRLMTNFAKQNRLFVGKTASFGGTDKARLAGEVVAGMAERDNIREFDTRKEAEAWLAQ